MGMHTCQVELYVDYAKEIEPHIGHLIGSGGGGRVYEGAWRGLRAAVKIMSCCSNKEYAVRSISI